VAALLVLGLEVISVCPGSFIPPSSIASPSRVVDNASTVRVIRDRVFSVTVPKLDKPLNIAARLAGPFLLRGGERACTFAANSISVSIFMSVRVGSLNPRKLSNMREPCKNIEVSSL
jgi:hypothetical protein